MVHGRKGWKELRQLSAAMVKILRIIGNSDFNGNGVVLDKKDMTGERMRD